MSVTLAGEFEFTLEDDGNATPGDTSAAFFVEFVDESDNQLYQAEGRCVLNLDVNSEPECSGDMDGNATFTLTAPGEFEINYQFGTTIEVQPGQQVRGKSGSSAEIFTDGFESGDTGTWGAYSDNTLKLSVSSDDPNVRFTIVTEPLINPGMNDAWVSAEAALQGFFFTVFPDLELFFLSWFTFDSVPPDAGVSAVFGAADQRWVTGAGTYSGNSATVSVELTSGGVINASDPLATQQSGYGSITIVFINCNLAVLTYDFPSVGLSGEITLNRVVTDNVALCQTLAAQ